MTGKCLNKTCKLAHRDKFTRAQLRDGVEDADDLAEAFADRSQKHCKAYLFGECQESEHNPAMAHILTVDDLAEPLRSEILQKQEGAQGRGEKTIISVHNSAETRQANAGVMVPVAPERGLSMKDMKKREQKNNLKKLEKQLAMAPVQAQLDALALKQKLDAQARAERERSDAALKAMADKMEMDRKMTQMANDAKFAQMDQKNAMERMQMQHNMQREMDQNVLRQMEERRKDREEAERRMTEAERAAERAQFQADLAKDKAATAETIAAAAAAKPAFYHHGWGYPWGPGYFCPHGRTSHGYCSSCGTYV
jgi:hypothetical protein